MNDLVTINLELIQLPKIPFDLQAAKDNVNAYLSKYDGLVFSEDDVKGLKATIAELNKAEKDIDEYRKQVKRIVSEPIDNFEKELNQLKAIVNSVRTEFKVGLDDIETRRVEARRIEVEDLVTQVAVELGIELTRLTIKPTYMNKTTSNKDILTDLKMQAQTLLQADSLKKIQEESIIAHCKIKSYENKLQPELQPAGYVRLLDMRDVDNIKAIIDADVMKLIEAQIVKPVVEPTITPVIVQPPNVEQAYLGNFVELWEIIGTEDQFEKLEMYMRQNDIAWVVKSE